MKNFLIKIICFLFILAFSHHAYAGDTLIFIIRVDDIMGRNTTILPRSIKPFESMADARQAKITWAVIPHRLIETANQDGSVAQELVASHNNGHEISQHGYNHICPRCNSTGHEMFCPTQQVHFSYHQQDSLIVAGTQILIEKLGLQPTTFVPPGHSADTTTFHALADRGFVCISTTDRTKSYLYPNLFNLTPSQDFTWALKPADYQSKLHQALNDIHTRGQADGYYCLLLHDYFIRQGYENGLVIQWTGELLDSLLADYGSRIQFMTLGAAASHFAVPPTAVNLDHVSRPSAMSLAQNYPNPFNSATTIGYALSQSTAVEITILNALGQRLATLVHEIQPAGEYHVGWNAANYASGIYLLRIRTAQVVQLKKMLLMR